jgi:hypothetical protein
MKKLTRKQWILVAVVAVVGLSILRSVTNGGGAEIPKDKTTLVEEVAPVATIAFDTPLDLGGGIFVTVASPSRFTPTQFMTNIDQKPQSANSFQVTIKNGGSAPLDFASVNLVAESGSNICFDMLGDLDINGAPTEPLAAGQTASYTYGVGCKAAAGDPLSLTVQIGESKVAVEGKIA